MRYIFTEEKRLPMEGIFCKELYWHYVNFVLLTVLLFSCKSPSKESSPKLFSLLESAQTHVNFVNHIDDEGSLNILDYLYYYNGGGVAAGDINNDGFTDLFLVSNKGKNKLFLNTGKVDKIAFRDISVGAGVEGTSDWNTGVTMADVNGDGWLDIYVCAVSNFRELKGANALYINNGVDANGRVTFTDKASDYGLAFQGFSTQAAFFDYDLDGDLDVFLLNHAVHTERSYDSASARIIPDARSGDYLFENNLITKNNTTDSLKFADVTKKAGIYQAAMGYGLGVIVTDFNNDGWDDIYVGNDFHEDDYFYVNNQDGTFRESVKEYFGHVSRFSMGCDAADINNDGFMDLMSLDMYPEDEVVEKSSAGEDPFDIFQFKLQYGYHYQYARNCLQLNRNGKSFSDIGLMAGVSATDWSWSPLIADFDNDGYQDIFVSNGIVRRPNDLDFIKYIAAKQPSGHDKKLDAKAIALMPSGEVHNYIFQGSGGLKFKNVSTEWGFESPTISNGSVYADFDNDGDLDLVTNNINSPAGIYENKTSSLYHRSYLKIKLEGAHANRFGIGAKIIIKHKGLSKIQQVMPTRGFLSSVEPGATIGLGDLKNIDTLAIVWPDRSIQILTHVKTNALVTLQQTNAINKGEVTDFLPRHEDPWLKDVSDSFKLDYVHRENNFSDFYQEPLIPFEVSKDGPRLAVGDVNADGLDDFYAGGAKGQSGKLFLQTKSGSFYWSAQPAFIQDSLSEDADAKFFDADGDRDLDLYVVSGGNELAERNPAWLDRLYINDGKGYFKESVGSIPDRYGSKSCVEFADMDNDGDMDLFVGGRVVTRQYGYAPRSYLLLNDGKGKFADATSSIASGLEKVGMVTAAKWFDWGNDGDVDLMVAGHWMPITIYENHAGKLTNTVTIENSSGFWNTIETTDFDKDGDIDFFLGNLGTNTKFIKEDNPKLKLFVGDLDKNGTVEQILSYQKNGQWYPAATKDELNKQLPFIRKKIPEYKDFAGKTMDEIFNKGELRDAVVLTVDRFESIYLENDNKQFKLHVLPEEAQTSPIFSLYIDDLNSDGTQDVLLGGNFYNPSVYQGRYDASYSLILKSNGKGNFVSLGPQSGLFLTGEVRDFASLKTKGQAIILVARNNMVLKVLKKNNSQ